MILADNPPRPWGVASGQLSRRLALGLAASLLAAASLTSCDGTPPVSSSSAEATVKGTVTVRGKPAGSGTVVFDPSNVRRRDATPRRAEIQPGGTYTITTLVGDNTISVTGPKFDRDEAVGTSQYKLDVPSGESTFDIVLPKP